MLQEENSSCKFGALQVIKVVRARSIQREAQSRPQSSSLLRMTDDGNSSGQSDFRSSADWLLKHNSITTGSEDDTGVNKDG